MLSIRPKIAEHALFLFGRSVHPELLQVYKTRQIERSRYSARIDITSDGHLISFSTELATVSEVICSVQQLLPQKRRLASQIFRTKSAQVVETRRNICYETKYELQQVGPDVFWMVQEQLQSVSREYDLIQKFDPSGRLPMGAFSYIHVEEWDKHLVAQALHTFPDDYQILKSFSTFTVDRDHSSEPTTP